MNLTREQILDMPAGSELDRLIGAHVMRLQFDGDTPTDGKMCWPLLAYSASPAAVMSVIDAVYRRFCGRIEISRVAWDEWIVTISGITTDRLMVFDFATAKGKTVALAVCRAALLAVLEANQ